MKTKSITRKQRPSCLATRGLGILGASILGLASLGCTGGLELRPKTPTFEAQAEFGGAATAHAVAAPSTASESYPSAAPQEVGPTASNYVQSGGGSFETAEITNAGATIAGRVTKGAPRFYAIDLAVGDSLAFKVYMQQLTESAVFKATLLEPDRVKLAGISEYVWHEKGSLERAEFNGTASQQGRHFIKVTAEEHPIEYRIEITGVNQAAR